MSKRLLFIADSESQLVPAYRIAQYFEDELGWTVVGNILPSKIAPSRRQVVKSGVDCTLKSYSLRQLFDQGILFAFDAIVLLLPGSGLYGFLTSFRDALHLRGAEKRPMLITGYNGVVYEKHLEGLLWRVGYDFICVNSRADHRRFQEDLTQLGADPSSLVTVGVLHAQGQCVEPLDFHAAEHKTLLFATQAVVPQTRPERAYVIEKLKSYAETHPSRKVVIKPRTLPGERTFHQEEFHYEAMYDEMYGRQRPHNLHFAYGNLEAYLPSTSLLVTVSSTAVFEALARGVPGAVLTDLGIKESLGNHFFRDSGLLTTMDALILDRVPKVNADWLRDSGFHPEDSLQQLGVRVEMMLEEQERLGYALPMREMFYSPRRAPFLYESQLPFKSAATRAADAMARPLYRKARKLVRSPLRFVLDSQLFREE